MRHRPTQSTSLPSIDAQLADGLRLQQAGQLDDAIACYRAALARDGRRPDANNLLGLALFKKGNARAGVEFIQRAVRAAPKDAGYRFNLGLALGVAGQRKIAEAAFREAIALNPRFAPAHLNLGKLCLRLHRHREAAAAFRAVIEIDAHNIEALSGLGSALFGLGEVGEAVACLEQTLALDPEQIGALDTLIFAENNLGRLDAMQMLALSRRFGVLARGQSVPFAAHSNPPDPVRPLKIGLISSDFRDHPVPKFLEGPLAKIDRGRFRLHAYSTALKEDGVTRRMRRLMDGWTDAADIADGDLAERIRADGIDILVDLNGHTSDNRLKLFALRPAPVSMTWLGYSGTTGLEEIDYILCDGRVLPSDRESSETPWRMPDSFLCFSPPQIELPVSPLPARARGVITFGSLNQLGKISDAAVSSWAEILAQVPQSRLLIKATALSDADAATRLRERFAAAGIGADRLELRGRVDSETAHLETYAGIDIALDSFPYNGTTTTMEALFMGVPVVGLAGGMFISRVGESVLSTAGLDDWVAADRAGYVALATRHAQDVAALAQLRAGLRAQLLQSPLCDARRFAGHLEAAWRGMWAEWCKRQGAGGAA